MSIRLDHLQSKLDRLLEVLDPPRHITSDQARADEIAALLRAIDRACPQNGYDGWWPRFEDALRESMRGRTWPTPGDVARAAKDMPRTGQKADLDDGWLEAGIQKRIRRWIDGSPGEGDKSIPPHLVTRERLNAIGVFGNEANRVLGYLADPYNHGIDKSLTHKERQRYADGQRIVAGNSHSSTPEGPDAAPLRHWTKIAAPDDPRWAEVRRARAAAGTGA